MNCFRINYNLDGNPVKSEEKMSNPRVLIFGAGEGYYKVIELLDFSMVMVEEIIDNDRLKIGQKFNDKVVKSPGIICRLNYDYIIIASEFYKEICDQLYKLGIDENKILSFFKITPLFKQKWMSLFSKSLLRKYLIDNGYLENIMSEIYSFIQTGEFEETRDIVSGFEQLFPGDNRTFFLKAFLLLKEKDYKKAEEVMQQGMEKGFINFQIDNNYYDLVLAKSYEISGEYLRAIQLYEKLFFRIRKVNRYAMDLIKGEIDNLYNNNGVKIEAQSNEQQKIFKISSDYKVEISQTLPKNIDYKSIIKQGNLLFFNEENILINWILTYNCNYRCSYCTQRYKRINIMPSLKLLSIAKENIINLQRRKIYLTLSGGEPTIIPYFIDFIKDLLHNIKNLEIKVITNLSRERKYYEELVQKIGEDINKLSFFTSFHHEFAEVDDFLNNIQFISNSGLKTTISVLAHPESMFKFKELCKKLNRIKNEYLTYNIKYIREGTDLDRRYESEDIEWIKKFYNENNEKNIFLDYVTDNNDVKRVFFHTNEIIAQRLDNFKGMYCSAGSKLIAIDPYGRVTPAVCFRGRKDLPFKDGNIYKRNTQLLFQRPIICPFNSCICISDLQVPKCRFYD